MGAIISISDLRKRASKTNTSAFFDQAIPYNDFFENKRVVLAELMHNTYDSIVDANLDPAAFIIDAASMTTYSSAPFDPDAAGEEMEGPSFNCYMDGDLYCMVTRVEIHEAQELLFSAELYMIKDYDAGNREWLFYSYGHNVWQQGPGEGFFDPEEIIESYNNALQR